MKLTRHNGRSGKNGTYNPKHNDRRFNLDHSEHIDNERALHNVYWDRYQGFHLPNNKEEEDAVKYSFEEIEKTFYSLQYDDYCEAQHERNRKNGHSERDRSTEDLRLDKKTSPEESIIQIGTIEQSVNPDVLFKIATDFFDQFEERFGEHVHILDWSLHLDEATPHIHERHVFDCENRYGEIAPQQEKALEALNIPIPHPELKPGKTNNRKIMFDSICREMMFEISLEHGLHLDREPEYGGREYLEKQDYILEKQRSLIEEKQKSLEEITVKLSDAESLVEEIASDAYEKACNVIIDTVVTQVQKENIKMVGELEQKLIHPEKRMSKREGALISSTINSVKNFLNRITERITTKVKTVLLEHSVSDRTKAEIKEAARVSIRERLLDADIRVKQQKPKIKEKSVLKERIR
ncbi:MAG: serine/arginine repetitive matrix protein 2 [Lachnospiraceae bacterium]|nr:serine/arginine repetitive matrix protein 2 [Lachnospiraceae bacterium]